jgi:hypothetical protein
MASTDPNPPRTLFTGASLLLALACLLYIAMMFLILGSEPVIDCGDPASCGITKGLGDVFEVLGGFCTLLLWIVLAILLLAGGIKGERIRGVAAILFPLSGVAAIVAGVLYSRYGAWSIVVPALLPPLIALYAVWARLPLHAALPAKIVNVAAWGAILILTIAPFPLSVIDASRFVDRDALRAKAEEKRALERARDVVRLQALTADSRLNDFIDDLAIWDRFVDWPPDVAAELARHHEQALIKARQVKTRQTDVVEVIKEDQLMDDLWQLDIKATPTVCEAYRDQLRTTAQDSFVNYPNALNEILLQLPNIRWLLGEHCDLNDALGTVATAIQQFCRPRCPVDSDEDRKISAFTAALAALRQPQ